MTRILNSFTTPPRPSGGTIVTVVVALVLLGSAFAQQSEQKTFASAAQASQALYDAVHKDDEQAVQAILGAGPELIKSDDDAEDKLEREHFAQKYQEMHRLVREPDGSTVLYIGAENWPFPIPLVQQNGAWRFDSDAGSQEVLARAIGGNETAAIEVCRALNKGTAQNVSQTISDPSIWQFAQRLANTGTAHPEHGPFHGYYFRVLAERPIGVPLVAYPATYGVTGVMSFVVVNGGRVYEKDLGPDTATLARQIQGKPNGKWSPVQ